MTSDMIPYLIVGFVSVFISAISQAMLKKASGVERKNIIAEYMNPLTIIAYGMFFLSTLLTMYALRKVPLTMSPMFESSSYIFVTIFGSVFFKEKVTKNKIIGLALILGGIVCFAL